MIPTLKTERLILRPFRESDFERYAQQCADPEVLRYIGQPIGLKQAWKGMAAHLGHWQLRGFGKWAVEERNTGLFMGHCGLQNPATWPGPELGWVFHRSAWGHGYATEAAQVALAYAFEEAKLPEVISLIHPENQLSIRVATKLGETLRRTIDFEGGDTLVYGITRDEWMACNAGVQA